MRFGESSARPTAHALVQLQSWRLETIWGTEAGESSRALSENVRGNGAGLLRGIGDHFFRGPGGLDQKVLDGSDSQ